MVAMACSDATELSPDPERALETTSPLDFGMVLLGAERALALTVGNPNAEAVQLDDVSVQDAEFRVADFPSSIEADGSAEVLVVFAPTGTPGARAGTVRLDYALGPLTVDVSGTAVTQNATVTPSRLEFGRLLPGSRRERSVDLRSTSPEPATLTVSMSGASGFGLSSAETRTVPPFGEETFTVTYDPGRVVETRTDGGQLQVRSVALFQDELRIDLRGSVQAQPISCPEAVDFGFVDEGRVERVVTCTNATDEVVSLEAVRVEAVDAGWTVEGQPETLEPGAVMELRLSFEATPENLERGTRATGDLVITPRNPEASELQLLDTRTALEVRGGRPRLRVAPAELDFEKVIVDGRSTLAFEISNFGEWAFERLLFALEDGRQFAVALDALRLEAGETRRLEVAAEPFSTGAHADRLVIRDDTVDQEVGEVGLRAEGVEERFCQDLAVSVEQLPFGLVHVERDRRAPVVLRNPGTTACFVGPFQRFGDAHVFGASEVRQIEIAAGGSATVWVHARTSTTGSMLTDLRFPYSLPEGGVGSVETTLMGVDVRQPVRYFPVWEFGFHIPDPAQIDFGSVGLACTNASRRFRLHRGDFPGFHGPARPISSISLGGPDAADFELRGIPPILLDGGSFLLDRGVPLDVDVVLQTVRSGLQHAWVEVMEPEQPVAYVVHVWSESAALPLMTETRRSRPLDWFIVSTPLPPSGARETMAAQLADIFGGLRMNAVDQRVGVFSEQWGDGQRLCKEMLVDPSLRPPAFPPGLCGFLGQGEVQGNTDRAWRLVDNMTRPSPTDVLEANFDIDLKSVDRNYEGAEMLMWANTSPSQRRDNPTLRRDDGDVALLVQTNVSTANFFGLHHDPPRSFAYLRDWAGGRLTVNYVMSGQLNDRVSDGNGGCDPVRLGFVEQQMCDPTSDGIFRTPGQPCWRDEVERTGGEVFFPVCDPGWEDRIADHLMGTLGHQKRFTFEHPVADGTMEVLVDGVVVDAGPTTWSYDAEYEQVVFEDAAQPTRDQEVTFRYQTRCEE